MNDELSPRIINTSKKYNGAELLALIQTGWFNYMREPSIVIKDLVLVIKELQIRLEKIEDKSKW